VFLLSNKETDSKRIVYVDYIELFNKFNLAKDTKKLYEQKISVQRQKVDSLYNIFQQTKKDKELSDLSKKAQINFIKSRKKLKQLEKHYTTDASSQVWDRLYQYAREFANKENIQMIISTQKNSNVMYGDSINNVTSELIKYCNTKYEGIDVK